MPRALQPELMDDPALPADEHTLALRGLARINQLSAAARYHLPALRRIASRVPGAVRVVDVASGSGDGAVAFALAAQARGIAVELTMTDISPRAVDQAMARATDRGVEARALVLDAVEGELPTADLVTCSLFLHHLSESQAERTLRGMRAACPQGTVSVNDLRRGRWGTLLARTVPRLVTTSKVVHTDAVISAKAAFTPAELEGLAERAGMSGGVVRSAFPARMTMTWSSS